jgi:hypothetical protein
LLYLAGAASVFLAGVLLTTLNPMLDLPKPVASWVIGGTPVELISLLLCLASACLIGLTNTQLSKH